MGIVHPVNIMSVYGPGDNIFTLFPPVRVTAVPTQDTDTPNPMGLVPTQSLPPEIGGDPMPTQPNQQLGTVSTPSPSPSPSLIAGSVVIGSVISATTSPTVSTSNSPDLTSSLSSSLTSVLLSTIEPSQTTLTSLLASSKISSTSSGNSLMPAPTTIKSQSKLPSTAASTSSNPATSSAIMGEELGTPKNLVAILMGTFVPSLLIVLFVALFCWWRGAKRRTEREVSEFARTCEWVNEVDFSPPPLRNSHDSHDSQERENQTLRADSGMATSIARPYTGNVAEDGIQIQNEREEIDHNLFLRDPFTTPTRESGPLSGKPRMNDIRAFNIEERQSTSADSVATVVRHNSNRNSDPFQDKHRIATPPKDTLMAINEPLLAAISPESSRERTPSIVSSAESAQGGKQGHHHKSRRDTAIRIGEHVDKIDGKSDRPTGLTEWAVARQERFERYQAGRGEASEEASSIREAKSDE